MAKGISVEVEGLSAVSAALERAVQQASSAAESATEQQAADLATDLRADAPVLTGYLRDSIGHTADNGEGEVEIAAEYAVYVNARDDFTSSAVRRAEESFPQRVADEVGGALP